MLNLNFQCECVIHLPVVWIVTGDVSATPLCGHGGGEQLVVI